MGNPGEIKMWWASWGDQDLELFVVVFRADVGDVMVLRLSCAKGLRATLPCSKRRGHRLDPKVVPLTWPSKKATSWILVENWRRDLVQYPNIILKKSPAADLEKVFFSFRKSIFPVFYPKIHRKFSVYFRCIFGVFSVYFRCIFGVFFGVFFYTKFGFRCFPPRYYWNLEHSNVSVS